MSLANPKQESNEEPIIIGDESYFKIINALDQALISVENCTTPIDPQAQEFKIQIENGRIPECGDPDPIVHELIKAWANENRLRLDTIFTEVKWFKKGE